MVAAPPPAVSRRVLVVDDEPIMTALVSNALHSGGFVTHTCASVREAREAIVEFDPDAAVIDISLGRGPTGIDLAHVLQHTHPGVAVLLLTKHTDLRAAGHEQADLPAGCGLLRKESVGNVDELIGAVEALLAERATRRPEQSSGPLAKLTTRQVAVLRMVAQGYTNPEISRKRGTTTSAVEKMLAAIYSTLGIEPSGEISQRAEAIRVFIANAGIPERP